MSRSMSGNQFLYINQLLVPVQNSAFSMSAWIYPTNITIPMAIVCFGSFIDNQFAVLGVRGDVAGDPVGFDLWDTIGSAAAHSIGVSINTWHHACAVKVNANLQYSYIDGGTRGSDGTSVNPNPDVSAIGKLYRLTEGWPFQGRIADVGIWDVALNDAEVLLLSQGYSPLFVQPNNLVYYLRMVTDNNVDYIGGVTMNEFGVPGVAGHPTIIYPDNKLVGKLESRLMQ